MPVQLSSQSESEGQNLGGTKEDTSQRPIQAGFVLAKHDEAV